MARRKRLLDDDDSDSSAGSDDEGNFDENDPDARAERELFANPYQHQKKRRRNGKEDALYGVFGEDSDDDRPSKSKRDTRRSDWTKAPAFTSGSKMKLNEETAMDIDEGGASEGTDSDDDDSEGEDEGEDGDEHVELPVDDSTSDKSSSSPPPPRTRDPEELDDPPARGMGLGFKASGGGIGFKSSGEGLGFKPSGGGIGFKSSGGGIGFKSSGGGIGFTPSQAGSGLGFKAAQKVETSSNPPSSKPSPSPEPTTRGLGSSTGSLPTAFGQSSRTFTLSSSSTSKPSAKAPLNAKDALHFNKIQGSFGARMLAKLGWEAGTGLGVSGEGIATPIEAKLRPQKMGIGHRGFEEKTDQSKAEARRRGEAVSDDEDGRPKGKKKAAKVKQDIWKKPKKSKVKIEHKTYEEILADAGQDTTSTTAGIGQIIDATGAVPREVSSLADVSMNTWTPTGEATRIPEVRHNVRLIAEACKSDLDGLAREARALNERKQRTITEDARLRKKVADEAELIARLQQVQIVANEIQEKAKELASVYEASLDSFTPLFYKLTTEFSVEVEKYRLDEIAVAAIAPTVRRMVSQWNPLEDPTALVSTFRTWKAALRVRSGDESQEDTSQAVDFYGRTSSMARKSPEVAAVMTPFESLLWNIWLPRVRSVLNNEWSPDKPHPAVRLYEAWSNVLPMFIKDNILDQLVLPKVRRAVEGWRPKVSEPQVSLKTLLFPWFPHLGLRLQDLLGEARRKIKSLFKTWLVGDPLPDDLDTWREVFDAGDWESLMLKYVVPKLGATLREDLRINPRNQDMAPIQAVILWSPLLHSSILSQLLETEFFPKWLDILHMWLIQPSVNYEEVSQWYRFWKDSFPESVRTMTSMERGFTRGLQLMNTAIELGPDAPTRLPKPDYRAEIRASMESKASGTQKPRVPAARAREITFREIVEEYAGKHDLVVMPSGKTHETSRMPLLRVSAAGKSGTKGGLLIYVLDDAVWASVRPGVGGETEEYRAISLEDMVLRTNGNE
ncbi:hypothetical protein ONZ45_g7826 [Pleurotus djamor]|nr:hypothetical protein ONZ45_g7826 [Pleurotus djamor]